MDHKPLILNPLNHVTKQITQTDLLLSNINAYAVACSNLNPFQTDTHIMLGTLYACLMKW
jgi:hypothetical protein